MTAPSDVPLLELRRVSKSFGGQPVLRDVSLQVHRGETLVVIGESGCGKSVTLKLLMHLLQPDAGEAYWDGRPVHALGERRRTVERLRFGYLFQSAALFDSLTVFENVAFGLRQNTRMSQDQIARTVRDRLRDVGLDMAAVGEKKPAQLSGGMRKRVGLARALALDPDVVLYDEPTTGLDPIMSDVINELILETRSRRPVTSLVITHDMTTVRKVATRIVMLHPLSRLRPGESQIIFDGTADETFSTAEPRVAQFVRGEAGARMRELAAA